MKHYTKIAALFLPLIFILIFTLAVNVYARMVGGGYGKAAWDANDTPAYLSDQAGLFTTRQNLITNSGLGVCSQSTLENHPDGNELVTNGDFDSDANDWNIVDTTVASVAGGQSGNCLEITRSGGTIQYVNQPLTLKTGHIYTFTAYVKSGSSGDEPFYIQTYKSGGIQVDSVAGTSTSTWTPYNITFVAPEANMSVYLMKNSATAGTMLFDSISVREVVPGFVTLDGSAPEGWGISYSYAYRISDDDVPDGSVYGVKLTSSAAGATLYWPAAYTNLNHLKKIAGKTVTFGAYVNSSDANDVLQFSDGTTFYSVNTSGSGSWEWLEVTGDISSSPAAFWVRLYIDGSGSSAYFAQPMLIFGSHIGEGNYSPIPQEIVWFDAGGLVSDKYDYTAFSDTSSHVGWEVDFSGKIPKNSSSVFTQVSYRDSGAAGLFHWDWPAGGYGYQSLLYITSAIPDQVHSMSGPVITTILNNSLITDFALDASGSGTADLTITPIGVQLQ